MPPGDREIVPGVCEMRPGSRQMLTRARQSRPRSCQTRVYLCKCLPALIYKNILLTPFPGLGPEHRHEFAGRRVTDCQAQA